jgi:hypothetical protein
MAIRCGKCSHVNQPDAKNLMRPWCVACGSGLADAGVPPPPAPADSGPARVVRDGLEGMPRPQMSYRPRRRSPEGMLFVGLVLLGLGVLSLYRNGEKFCNGWASGNWPKTRGKVMRSWLEEYISNKGAHTFEVRAVYTYTVAGIRYENDTVEFTSQLVGGGREYGEKQQAKYAPAGKACDVYYDPNQPQRSCLLPGLSGVYMTIVPCLTVFFFLLGGVTTWTAVRGFLASL